MPDHAQRPRDINRTLAGYEAEYLEALRRNSPWGAEHARRAAKRMAIRLGLPAPPWVNGYRHTR